MIECPKEAFDIGWTLAITIMLSVGWLGVSIVAAARLLSQYKDDSEE